MSTLARYSLEGEEFIPVNNDSFSLFFERNPTERWSNDIGATNLVRLPEAQYKQVRTHIDTYGIQRAMKFNIMLANQNFQFMADLTKGTAFEDTEAEISIERFRSKDDVRTSIANMSFEALFQGGYIKESDFIKIPYVIIRENAGDQLFNCLLMGYFVADQLIESVKTTAQLVADLVMASTPSANAGGPVVNIGAIARYALLILLETAKLVALSVALTRLAQQFIELIYPRLRYFNAMTVDSLITIGLSRIGMTYTSVLSNEFKRFTILPIPVDFKNKKWWDLLSTEDDRILNRGYPTSSDGTIADLGGLIDEMVKMCNLKPMLRGNVLHLQPKGTYVNPTPTIIPNNFNMQDEMEHNFSVDCSEWWQKKTIQYVRDFTDKMLYDNPRGLGVEYLAYADDQSEWTKISGYTDIKINLSLGTVKKETKIEKEIKKVAKALDSFLGTNLLAKTKNRDGVLALSQSQFEIPKLLYQIGGKQTSDYLSHIGANALWTKYHYMDVPENLCFRVYNQMPIAMNNETFEAMFNDDLIKLETDEQIDVIDCNYVLEESTAEVSFRKKDVNFGRFVKVRKIHED